MSKRKVIKRVLVIISSILVFLSTTLLIVMSCLNHGKKYIFEGGAITKKDGSTKYEVVEEKVIIDFLDETNFRLTYFNEGEIETFIFVYTKMEGNYIKVANVDGITKSTMYVDAYQMKEFSAYTSENAPAERVFICKTNQILKIVSIVTLIMSSITLFIGLYFYIIDFKKYKNNQKNELKIFE